MQNMGFTLKTLSKFTDMYIFIEDLFIYPTHLKYGKI